MKEPIHIRLPDGTLLAKTSSEEALTQLRRNVALGKWRSQYDEQIGTDLANAAAYMWLYERNGYPAAWDEPGLGPALIVEVYSQNRVNVDLEVPILAVYDPAAIEPFPEFCLEQDESSEHIGRQMGLERLVAWQLGQLDWDIEIHLAPIVAKGVKTAIAPICVTGSQLILCNFMHLLSVEKHSAHLSKVPIPKCFEIQISPGRYQCRLIQTRRDPKSSASSLSSGQAKPDIYIELLPCTEELKPVSQIFWETDITNSRGSCTL